MNDVLNCFVTIAAEQAEERARSLMRDDRTGERPLLWGIPVPVKDLAPTRGLRTTFSCRAFMDHIPEEDSPLVAMIRSAGMNIVGKTNTPEFGILPVTESDLNGICRNPWVLDLSAGGSSGGAAASVAAGLTSIAHGSDGAGSLRIPASCCGVFAVMLPHGRLPPSSRVTFGRGVQDGVISRTVADAVCYLTGLNVLSPEELAMATAVDPWPSTHDTIAVTCMPPIDCTVDPDCSIAVTKAASLLVSAGYRVEERTPDWSSESILDDMMLLRSSIPVAYGDPDGDLLDRTTQQSLRIAAETPTLDLHRTLVRLRAYAERIARFLGDDILLTPTVARPSVPHGWVTAPTDPGMVFHRSAEFAPFTAFANLMGLCAVSIPLHWTDNSVPVGIQLASEPKNLAKLLNLAARLERLVPWTDRIPPVSWV